MDVSFEAVMMKDGATETQNIRINIKNLDVSEK